jgi:hypothetical protein
MLILLIVLLIILFVGNWLVLESFVFFPFHLFDWLTHLGELGFMSFFLLVLIWFFGE